MQKKVLFITNGCVTWINIITFLLKCIQSKNDLPGDGQTVKCHTQVDQILTLWVGILSHRFKSFIVLLC